MSISAMTTPAAPMASSSMRHPLAVHLEALAHHRFNGRVDVYGSAGASPWSLYFYLGRIFYAAGGTQAARRWRRLFAQHCGTLNPAVTAELARQLAAERECREYHLLSLLLERGEVEREKAVAMLDALIDEVMLDIALVPQVQCRLMRNAGPAAKLAVFTVRQILAKADLQVQRWQNVLQQGSTLNDAPILRLPQRLQQMVPPVVFETMRTRLDGRNNLRELAASMNRDALSVVRSLMPYVNEGIIELVAVSEMPAAAAPPPPPRLESSEPTRGPGPLIACIDDSPQVCAILEEILQQAGYRCATYQDPIRACAQLLQQQPDLVFLDLVMPTTSGYEICARLRKVPALKNTPIILLTAHVGILDRVRAKMLGLTDMMQKPIEPAAVLAMVRKHLAADPQISVTGATRL